MRALQKIEKHGGSCPPRRASSGEIAVREAAVDAAYGVDGGDDDVFVRLVVAVAVRAEHYDGDAGLAREAVRVADARLDGVGRYAAELFLADLFEKLEFRARLVDAVGHVEGLRQLEGDAALYVQPADGLFEVGENLFFCLARH